MIKNAKIRKIAKKALDEGRLFWCVTDRYGRPCNGGDQTQRMDPPIATRPGRWTKQVDDPRICSQGWHVTTDPLRWMGELVWLVEVDEILVRQRDKVLVNRRRALALVDPDRCIDLRIWVATIRPRVQHTDLRSADLHNADLCYANLCYANLRYTNLVGANLRYANLVGANLRYANLQAANLRNVNLRNADLRGANLCYANLCYANLRYTNLVGANLRYANLIGTTR